jgi:hypothetical protein
LGGGGALLAALISARLTRWLGVGRTIAWSLAIWGLEAPLLPLIHAPRAVMTAAILTLRFVGDIPIALYFIAEASLRRAIIPPRWLGRAHAGMEFLAHGVGPVGALAGGLLAARSGSRVAWLVAAAGILSASAWVLFSEIPRLRSLPAASPGFPT